MTPNNQWTSDSFEMSLLSAARFEAAKRIAMGVPMEKVSISEIRDEVMKEWLKYAYPAGEA